ncbi:hypothetical protein CIHG_05856 [Coccidioides immitis H538.4]|uniref:Uncharacterized protein n=3 Tax=Coccidioides immitis TaxID=5501 RepID=A0A0J8TR93_COCIT|nr:hypothetical protein CIRG_01921 [Coccidioides immitis RMSCC 2394]KMU76237.1 hypothetical protein CISG_00972 [Coccidioides immitis RMSCC 3703]KMU88088.1 hypothetical protein CIHG_05856 [Coccidioides immitis H538.4]
MDHFASFQRLNLLTHKVRAKVANDLCNDTYIDAKMKDSTPRFDFRKVWYKVEGRLKIKSLRWAPAPEEEADNPLPIRTPTNDEHRLHLKCYFVIESPASGDVVHRQMIKELACHLNHCPCDLIKYRNPVDTKEISLAQAGACLNCNKVVNKCGIMKIKLDGFPNGYFAAHMSEV